MRDLTLPPTSTLASTIQRIPGVAIMLILCVLCFSLLSHDFLSIRNISNVGVQSAILLMISLPMTLVIMTEGIDMSIGAVLTFCGVVVAYVLGLTHHLPLAIFIAVSVGLVIGAINGAIIVYANMPPFVVTLGMLGICQSLALILTDGQSLTDVGDSIGLAYNGNLLGIPYPICFAVVSYFLSYVLLYHTRFGTYICAIGGNREALKLAGVRVNLHHVAVYAFSGLMAGFASILLTARMSAGHPTAAIGMEFDAIAAVIVGGTSFEKGNGWLFGTFLGVLTVGVLRNGLNLVGVQSSLQVASIGLLVLIALLLDSLKSKAYR
ncbi:ABC transporter permease [Polynucleobacter kasalickyi]|uniref:Monosaccharide ABC transporter membrane protein, CUT2 family n=1 Tax=Polynucleobacter kasalickyi TaxID=1938817 RepID=A0A1W2BNU4_9BURK|nr:ABC transporter permease [Polynucleobacter kasalickyi]SMC74332.1 monosaccharide ABC transporter membrane protein, CUT2 family [Polynucleobacter kasalickyi]